LGGIKDSMNNKIKIAIAGATGFTGLELIHLLTKHHKAEIKNLISSSNAGKSIKIFDKRIKKKLPRLQSLKTVNWLNVDILFLALPNGEAQKIIKQLYNYKHLKFIDLSADFRLTNPINFKQWYQISHRAKELIKDSLYSIPEVEAKNIQQYRIIANPGCYPTSIQIPLIPLIKKNLINLDKIVIDSMSGYSGAGKNYKNKFKHKNFYHSIQAYGIEKHRHVIEIVQQLNKISKKKINFTFNPHLLPVFRGLMSTIHLELKKNKKIQSIINCLKSEYKKNKFIKISKINNSQGTGSVLNTNNCEISVCSTRLKNQIVIFSSIDNLIKGASGQAIQNMNLMFNLKENYGLK
jgi:N-acetyl-gamma-glutamyl-phosphate reductase